MAAFAPGGMYDTGGRSYRPPTSRGVISAPPRTGFASPMMNTMRATARGLGRGSRGRGMKRGFSRRASR